MQTNDHTGTDPQALLVLIKLITMYQATLLPKHRSRTESRSSNNYRVPPALQKHVLNTLRQ